MKVALFLLAIVALTAAFPQKNRVASECSSKCQLPDCRCSGVDIPGKLPASKTPQFFLSTFDDAVTVINTEFYRKALFGRKNPDGCPISATFFVSHEYTDYTLVHELHANGNEIALHSITHQLPTTYWKEASVDTLTKEFADMRNLISTYANISTEGIKGLRMPYLQMTGDNQFQMMYNNKIEYDCSWPTDDSVTPGLWPYTTEYASTQECSIEPCPTSSFPGVWVIPMISWEDMDGTVCSMIDACVGIPETTNELVSWMKREFHKQYDGNRAPLGFYAHSAWFSADETGRRLDAYIAFLDYLETLPDVYMVSGSQVIDWVRKPISIEDMLKPNNTKCPTIYNPSCTAKTCELIKEGKEDRWLTSCKKKCPKSYPWLGNPLGNL